ALRARGLKSRTRLGNEVKPQQGVGPVERSSQGFYSSWSRVCQGDGMQMRDYPEDKLQEQPAPAPDNGHAAAEADAVTDQYDETLRPLAPGDIVEGRVVHISADEVLVDVGYKSEGRIPLSQLGLRPGQTPADVLRVDDSIAVQVMRVD